MSRTAFATEAFPRARLIRWLLVLSLLVAGVSLYDLVYNWLLPVPLNCRENSEIFDTDILLQGKNPFGLEAHPVFLYVYGIVQALLAMPLFATLGDSLPVLRIISFTALGLSCGVLYWILRVSRVSWPIAFAGALLLFDHLAFVANAQPDNLGLFLMLLSLAVPLRWNFSVASLVASAVLSLLAFYTKLYFAEGAPFVAIYLFLFRDKRAGLELGIGFLLAVGASVLVANRLLPLYFTDVFYNHINSEDPAVRHVFQIMRDYSPRALWLVAILGWSIWQRLRTGHRPRFRFDVSHLRQPLFPEPAVQWSTFLLVAFTALYVFKLGLHTGGSINYVYNLITPFLIWRACLVVGVEAPESRTPVGLLLLAVVFVGGSLVLLHTYRLVARERAIDQSWKHATALIAAHHDVFAARAFAGILWTQHKPVYDTGMTEYYRYGEAHNPSPLMPAYRQRCLDFQRGLLDRVRQRQFDLILVFPIDTPLLEEKDIAPYYQKTEVFRIWMSYMWYDVDVWTRAPQLVKAGSVKSSPSTIDGGNPPGSPR